MKEKFHHNVKRIITCIVMSAIVLTTGCSGNLQFPLTSGTNDSAASDANQLSDYIKIPKHDGINSDDESWYIQAHLDFVESGEYKDLCTTPGGLAATMSKEYRANGSDTVNSFWEKFSNIAMILGSGTYETKNEYQILIGALMQSSAAKEAYNESCRQAFMTSVLDMISGINNTLKDTDTILQYVSPDKLEEIDSVAKDLDEILTDIERVSGKSAKEVENLYKDAWDGAKEKLGLVFSNGDTKLLKGVFKGLELTGKVTEIVSDTFSDMMDEYLVLSSCTQATDEYFAVWRDIQKEIRANPDKEAAKLADALDEFLNKLEEAKKDIDKVLVKKAMASGGKNLFKWGLETASDKFDTLIDAHPVLKGIRMGLSGGIAVSNCITNLDDAAYYGKMFMGGGIVAEAAYNVMRSAESKLDSNKTFSNAVLFDEAFNIYKNIQLACYDYGINYCTVLSSATVAKVFKSLAANQVVESDILLIQKVVMDQIYCHSANVKNNGHNVVGVGDSVYYFENTSETFSPTGLLGYFPTNSNTKNNIKKLTGEDAENIANPCANSQIYIWNNNLYVDSKDGWIYYDLTEDGEKKAHKLGENVIVKSASQKPDMLVTDLTGSKKLNIKNASGKQVSVPYGNYATILGYHSDSIYFYTVDGKTNVTFYRYVQNAEKPVVIAKTTINVDDSNSGISSGTCIFEEDGIYLNIGVIGGTGRFYQKGSLIKLDYENGMEVLIESGSEYSIDFTELYLKRDEDGNRKIYFSHGVSFSNAGNWNTPWISDGVYSIDLETKKITEEKNFVLCSKYGATLQGDTLKMLLDDSGEYKTILTKEQVEKLGFKNLAYNTNADPYTFAPWTEVIDSYAYVCLRQMTRNDAASLGWRQGYTLSKVGVYRINLSDPSAEIKTLYEFKN